MSQSSKARARRQAGMGEVLDEMKELLDASLVPIRAELGNLPNKQFLDELVNNLSMRLMNKIDAKLKVQEERIKALEDRLAVQESNMAVLKKLEARLDEKLEKFEKLEERVDDGEQYSSRLCLRLYNIDLAPAGAKEDCLQKVQTFLEELDCGVSINAVDRAHRIGPRASVKGKEKQQIIVKIKTFKERTLVYRARKRLLSPRPESTLRKEG